MNHIVQIVRLKQKQKKYPELEAHETLKRVASANAILNHYKSSSLTMRWFLEFLKANFVKVETVLPLLSCSPQFRRNDPGDFFFNF